MDADDDGEIIIRFGGACTDDTHLASIVVAIDDEIFEYLEQHEAEGIER